MAEKIIAVLVCEDFDGLSVDEISKGAAVDLTFVDDHPFTPAASGNQL